MGRVEASRVPLDALRVTERFMVTTDDLTARVDPVFIIGSPRSGTSAFAWALAQHPELTTGPESDFLYYLLKGGPKSPLKQCYLQGVDTPAGLKGRWLESQKVDWDEFVAHAGMGFGALFASRTAGSRWIDSSPSSTLVLDDLARMFPSARFVHVLRDGRSVVSSMIASSFPVKFASSFTNACETWSVYASRAHAFCEAHPDRCCEVRNEDWSEDGEGVLRKVFESLGVEYSDRATKFLSKKRINSSFNAGEGSEAPATTAAPVKSKAHVWTAWTGRQKRAFKEIAAPTMSQLNYDTSLD
ncbi:MAG: hypothetical protein ACI9EF_000816 [Pseudohongiellaceae bacterium]|jgi:hypothetical protein